MTIDIGKILQAEPYDCVRTAIGELCIFGISLGGQIKLRKEIGRALSECQPIEFVKQLVPHICFPRTSLKEGRYKPDNPVLTSDDVSSITQEELEQIAKIYVETSEYLFKKLTFEKRKNDKGETVSCGKYGEIEYPHQEN